MFHQRLTSVTSVWVVSVPKSKVTDWISDSVTYWAVLCLVWSCFLINLIKYLKGQKSKVSKKVLSKCIFHCLCLYMCLLFCLCRCLFVSQVMFSHHFEQMYQRSQVSKIALWRWTLNTLVIVFVFVFFYQVRFSHHSDQMFQRSQASRCLCSKIKSHSVTLSRIELSSDCLDS